MLCVNLYAVICFMVSSWSDIYNQTNDIYLIVYVSIFIFTIFVDVYKLKDGLPHLLQTASFSPPSIPKEIDHATCTRGEKGNFFCWSCSQQSEQFC